MKGRASVAVETTETPPDAEPQTESAEADPDAAPEPPAAVSAKKPTPPAAPKMTRPMQEIRLGEDQALKDYLDLLGPDGAIRVRIHRENPKTIRVNGRDYPTAGHLATVNECIDEEWLSAEYGGGTYKLTITSRRQGEGGSYKYAGHRQVVVAGDPKIEKLPVNATATPPSGPAQTPESTGMVKEVMGLLKEELGHAREAKPQGIDPAVQVLIEQLRADARRRDDQMDKLQQQLDQARNQKPPEDPIKDEMLKSMISGQSGHVTALQLRHEAEIRQLKEGIIQDQKRIEDRHDRTTSEMRQSHELALANLKASYEREIAAMRTSHETALMAARATVETQVHVLNSEIKRLERDNDELRKDNRELREKKEKGVIEQIKEMKTLKEAFGGDEEDGGSTAQQVIAAIPAAIEGIGGIINSRMAAQQQGQPAQAKAVVHAQPKPRVVQNLQTGERAMQVGNKLYPVKPRPKLVTTDAGQQIEIPKIEEPTIKLIISQLEAAFGRDEDPNIVAQSAKAMIPPDILAWIAQHHSEQASGVDLFMQKVAKLPGTSPLASQGGRNWLRKVGAALMGGEST